MTAYGQDDFATAERELMRANSLLPSPELAFNLARVCERLDKAEQAAHWYSVYLETGSPSGRERLEIQRRIASARKRVVEKGAQVALLPATEGALQAEARQFFERAVRLYKRGKFRAAGLAFGTAYRLSQAPELLFNMALVAEQDGRLDEAVTHLRSYLRAQPDVQDREGVEAHIMRLRAAGAR